MKHRHLLIWHRGLFLAVTGVVSGCGSNAPPVMENPPPAVSVSQPVEREVVDYDSYEGRMGAVQKVEVRARVRGHLAKVGFQDGQMVKEGDPLFEIDPRPYKAALDAAAAQVASAEANLELAKTEYARTAVLVRTKAVSDTELTVWKAKQATAAAERLRALASVEQAKLDLDFTKIAAPINGKISRSQVDVGNLVNAGGGETLLTTITSVDPMYVYFNVNERSLLRYRKTFRKDKTENDKEVAIKDLKIPVEIALEGEAGYPYKGVIDFADNRVDPGTGTIQVRGVLPNSSRILDAGMRARVRVPVGSPYKALLVTDRAIGTDQNVKYLYVVGANNVAKRRDVQLGRMTDDLRVIEKGLNPGDKVIINGIQRVHPEMTVDPKPGEMPGLQGKAKS